MIPSSAWVPSFRALLIGAVGYLVVGAGFQYSDMILKTSGFGNWFFTPGPVIMFFVLVLFLNPLVGLIRRRWMLSPAELAQIYVMWIVGSGVTTDGFVSYFLPKVTSVIYYASPENNWRESLLPYIPDWIIPHREFAQIRNFYEEFEPVRRDQVENRDFKHHVVQEVVAGIVGNKKGDLSGLP